MIIYTIISLLSNSQPDYLRAGGAARRK